MTLTSNQKETLHALVIGECTGMLTKPLPSLIKRGLVVEVRSQAPTPMFGQRLTIEYKLTTEGLETYQKLRTSWHEARLKKLDEDFRRELAWASGKTHKA